MPYKCIVMKLFYLTKKNNKIDTKKIINIKNKFTIKEEML